MHQVRPTVYQPYAQSSTDMAHFEIRYRGNEGDIVSAVRAAMRQVDPRLPIFDLRTQREQSEESLAEERRFANLSSSMGGLTLALAAVGLYGILSYSVGRRTPEQSSDRCRRRPLFRLALAALLFVYAANPWMERAEIPLLRSRNPRYRAV